MQMYTGEQVENDKLDEATKKKGLRRRQQVLMVIVTPPLAEPGIAPGGVTTKPPLEMGVANFVPFTKKGHNQSLFK